MTKCWLDMDLKNSVGLAALGALVFVWSVPGSTALRYLLMALALVVFVGQVRNLRDWLPYRSLLAGPLITYAVLTLWLIVGIFLSDQPAWVAGELKGQWIKSTLCLGLGMSVATVALRNLRGYSWQIVAGVIFAVLFSQVVGTLLDGLGMWVIDGMSPFQMARLSGSRTGMSYVTNIYMALLAAELVSRLLGSARMLPALGMRSLVLALVLGLICTAMLGTRNGMLGILFLLGACAFIYWLPQLSKLSWRRVIAGVVLTFTLIGVLGTVMVSMDARWQRLGGTLPIALDIDGHTNWIVPERDGMPKLPSGDFVDESAYLRIAWLAAGAREVVAHPLGVGYGRNAFGHAVAQRYGEGHGHSHSSIIDFVLGAGIPGLLLWLVFMGSIILAGWRAYRHGAAGAPALALIFLCTGFLGRSCVDSNMRDHTMEMFMFLLGFLLLGLRSAQRNGDVA